MSGPVPFRGRQALHGGSGPRTSATAFAAVLRLTADFNTSTTPGVAATLPAWLSGSRGSTRIVYTSASTQAASAVASGALAISQRAGASSRGLTIERGTVNLLTNPNAFTTGWTNSGTLTSGITGPDGAATGWHFVEGLNAGQTYQTTPTLGLFGTVYQVSIWGQQGSSTKYDGYFFQQGTSTRWITGNAILGASWARVGGTYASLAATTALFVVADGFGTPGALDAHLSFAQLEAQPYPTTYYPGTRAAEECHALASDVVFGGRLHVRATITPMWGTAQLGSSQDANADRMLFVRDATTQSRIVGPAMQVYCIVEGTPVVFPLLLSWNAGDMVTIDLACGNGPPTGWVQVNGGAKVPLGAVSTSQPYLRSEDSTIWFFSDGTVSPPTSQIDAEVQALAIYQDSAASPPGITYYASATGSGTGLTRSSPASISAAQTLARAHGSGATVLVRAGTSRAAMALTAADNGTTWQAYPGESPIVSGHALLTGSWAQVGASSIWQLSGVTGPIEQLYVNGVRATLAGAAIATPTDWTITGTGFTAPDTTIAGYAVPTDARIVFRTGWRYGWAVLSSVVGTALTVDTMSWGDITSGGMPTNAQLIRVENAYELLTTGGQYYFNAGSGVLSYYARAGDSMGSSPVVETGALDTVVTIGGAIGTPASGISLRGLTIEGSTWAVGATAPSARPGYSAVQAGVAGLSGPAGSHGTTVTGPYYMMPSAVTVGFATGATIAGCTLRRLGAAALALGQGAQGTLVEGTTIVDVNGSGIIEGGVQQADAHETTAGNLTGGNVIRRNLIQNTGLRFFDTVGILLAYTTNTVVDQNTIDGTGYVGVHLGWGWGERPGGFDLVNANTGGLDLVPTPRSVMGGRRVTGNRLLRVGMGWATSAGSMDGGGLYGNGPEDPSSPSTVSGNYVELSSPNNTIIYMDSAKEYTNFTGNVAGPAGTSRLWLLIQPQVEFSSAIGNYAPAGSFVENNNPSGNTVSGNTVGAYGAPALEIIRAAGAYGSSQ